MTREIELHSRDGAVTGVALVDDEDYARFGDKPWCLHNGYAFNSRRGYLHRLILDAPRGLQVDHINRDRLDNRRSNLRLVTQAQNAQNVGARRGSTSPHRGVSFNSRTGRWVAQVKVGGRAYYCKHFDSELEAAAAAARVREEYMTHA